jgi:diacylglycerol kinase (ATP)
MPKKYGAGRVKLIANPGARKLRASGAVLEQVTRLLMDRGLEVDVALTHPKRHAVPIAKKAVSEGYQAVIAMGGDGTIGAVIEGLAGSDVHLGIIPAGTENDFAVSLGIPEDIEEACTLIAADTARPVDLGQLSTKERRKFPFFMVTAVGLIASVYPKIKNVPEGDFSEIKEAISRLLQHEEHPKVWLTLDDESRLEVETMLVLIVNTPLIGLKNLVAPDASLEDGLLDVIVFPGFSKAGLLAYFARTAEQTPAPDGRVERYRARRIKIKTSPKLDIAAEGMIMGKGTARIKALPGAVWVIAPPPGAGAEKPLGETESLPAPIAITVGAEQAETS